MTPHGWEIEGGWRHFLEGASAVEQLTRFDAGGFPSRVAATVPQPPKGIVDAAPTAILAMAHWAASRALDSLPGGHGRIPCGLVYTAGGACRDHASNLEALRRAAFDGAFDDEAYRQAFAALGQQAGMESQVASAGGAWLARQLGLDGEQLALDSACASGAEAVAMGGRWIRSGRAARVLVVASDSHVNPAGLTAFCLLGALSERNDEPRRASRPFDRNRDGFVLGEGAAALLLEDLDLARERGALVLGELRGWGSACDAYRITDPDPDARGARLAISRALAAAGVSAEQIGYVNAHGTSTLANDRNESRALQAVFGASLPPTSSTKSMIGHLITAAGAVEAIICLLALRDQRLPPTINLDELDPECELDVVPNVARAASVQFAMSSSFGFGGSCTSLVFSRAPDP